MHLRTLSAFLAAAFLAASGLAQNADLSRHLRDTYEGKVRFLRGFYSADKLHYADDGSPGQISAGDWTVDGLVIVKKLSVSRHRLTIKGGRVLVSVNGRFQFGSVSRKGLNIEADLGPSEISQASVDAALARIFLTDQDDFSDLVPDYWKPCIQAGLTGRKSKCIFSDEFQGIPGLTAPKQVTDFIDPSNPGVLDRFGLTRIGKGVGPPRALFQPNPEFSEAARKAKYQGTILLDLVVDRNGLPLHIQVVDPMGYGLEAKAVQAVERWKFTPAEKDGQPVATGISVEVDFHLY